MSKKTIKYILKRLDRLEKVVFGSKKRQKAGTPSKRVGLPSLILQLREQYFFKKPKTALEVYKKIQATYSCDLNRVEVALHRLHKIRKLRKTSKIINKKKIIAYVW